MRTPERYVRFFPKRWAQLAGALTPRELVGYVSVLMHYAQVDGELLADDHQLSILAGLPPPTWRALRAKLLALGLAHVDADGRWVDTDQHENLAIQQRASAAQRARIRKRWNGHEPAAPEARP